MKNNITTIPAHAPTEVKGKKRDLTSALSVWNLERGIYDEAGAKVLKYK